ncbi:hypothetical protein ABKN59_000466 [Abortiporus biennis]
MPNSVNHTQDDLLLDLSHLRSYLNTATIASFFLGWLFLASLFYIFHLSSISSSLSRAVRYIQSRIPRSVYQPDPQDVEAHTTWSSKEKTGNISTDSASTIRRRNDHHALTLILNLCFALASLAYFLSTLTYDEHTKWDTGCTILFALGCMSSQAARIVGVFLLFLEVRRKSVKKWEALAVFTALLTSLGCVLATNALSTAVIRVVEGLEVSICTRRYYLPTTVISAGIHVMMVLYLLARIVCLGLPEDPHVMDCFFAFLTMNSTRALSLLLLDISLIVPDAIATSLVVQFVPFSVLAVITLAAFNYSTPSTNFSIPIAVESDTRRSPIFDIGFPDSAQPRRSPDDFITHANLVFTESIVTGDDNKPVVEEPSTAQWHNSVRVPHSAPPGIQELHPTPSSSYKNRGHILPSQVEFANRLSEEPVEEENLWESGPVVRPTLHRPKMSIVVPSAQETAGLSAPAMLTPGSAIFGGGSSKHRASASQPQGTSGVRSSYMFSPMDSVMTPHSRLRDSYATSTPSERYAGEPSRVSFTSRKTSRQSMSTSRESMTSRSAWRGFSMSSASVSRSKQKETLPILQEGASGRNFRLSAIPPQPVRPRRTTFGSIVPSSPPPSSPLPPLPLSHPHTPIEQNVSSSHAATRSTASLIFDPPSNRLLAPVRGPRPPPIAIHPGGDWRESATESSTHVVYTPRRVSYTSNLTVA